MQPASLAPIELLLISLAQSIIRCAPDILPTPGYCVMKIMMLLKKQPLFLLIDIVSDPFTLLISCWSYFYSSGCVESSQPEQTFYHHIIEHIRLYLKVKHQVHDGAHWHKQRSYCSDKTACACVCLCARMAAPLIICPVIFLNMMNEPRRFAD